MHACLHMCALCVEARQKYFFETWSLYSPWPAWNLLCRPDYSQIQRSKCTASAPDCCWLKVWTSTLDLYFFCCCFFWDMVSHWTFSLLFQVQMDCFPGEPWGLHGLPLVVLCWGPHEAYTKMDRNPSSHAHTTNTSLPEPSLQCPWRLDFRLNCNDFWIKPVVINILVCDISCIFFYVGVEKKATT